MKYDKLIAEDELPAPENIEDETAEVIEVINKSQEKLPPINWNHCTLLSVKIGNFPATYILHEINFRESVIGGILTPEIWFY